MPGGDGTGPMGYGPGMGWGGGRWGCRGAYYGAGGRGWRNWFRATGVPGWMRSGFWGGTDLPGAYAPSPAANEENALRRQADMLESELRWIRGRLDEIAARPHTEG